mgnify:CR=1 FL=1
MNKLICLFIGVLSLFVFFAAPASAIEKLSDAEMHEVTAQAGISVRTGNVSVFLNQQGRQLTDINTYDRFGTALSPNGYVTFDLHSMMILNDTIHMDVGVFNESDALTFTDTYTDETGSSQTVERSFAHPLNNLAMVSLYQEAAGDPEYLIQMDNIAVYNHDLVQESMIGDLNISDILTAESALNLFPPASDNGVSGIRGVGGTRIQVDTLKLENPDQHMTASVSGIMMGAAFTGDPLPESESSSSQLDPSTWAFDEGLFQVGIPYYFNDDPEQEDTELNSHPFEFDIVTDDTRSGDFQSYMRLNAPMRGSIRIQNISSDNFDMGAIAIDGIRLYKNVVEFPGRGIGH